MCSTSDTFSCMVFYGRKTLGMNIKLVRSSKIVFLWRCYQSNVIQLKFQNACIASVVILQNIFITSLWSSGFCKSSLHFFSFLNELPLQKFAQIQSFQKIWMLIVSCFKRVWHGIFVRCKKARYSWKETCSEQITYKSFNALK